MVGGGGGGGTGGIASTSIMKSRLKTFVGDGQETTRDDWGMRASGLSVWFRAIIYTIYICVCVYICMYLAAPSSSSSSPPPTSRPRYQPRVIELG